MNKSIRTILVLGAIGILLCTYMIFRASQELRKRDTSTPFVQEGMWLETHNSSNDPGLTVLLQNTVDGEELETIAGLTKEACPECVPRQIMWRTVAAYAHRHQLRRVKLYQDDMKLYEWVRPIPKGTD